MNETNTLRICEYVNAKRISDPFINSIAQWSMASRSNICFLPEWLLRLDNNYLFMCVWSCVQTSGQHSGLCTIPDALMSPPTNWWQRWELKKKNTVASELSLFICFSTHKRNGVCLWQLPTHGRLFQDKYSNKLVAILGCEMWKGIEKRPQNYLHTKNLLYVGRKTANIYEYRLIESTLKNFHLDRIVSPLCHSASVWSIVHK